MIVDLLILLIAMILLFVLFTTYSVIRIKNLCRQGLFFNTWCKKMLFIPALVHFILVSLFLLLVPYVTVMSFLAWSTHPLIEQYGWFWSMWWYWLIISPIIWLAYLKQDQIMLILHKMKNKEQIIPTEVRKEYFWLLNILYPIIAIMVLAIILCYVPRTFGNIVSSLLNALYHTVV